MELKDIKKSVARIEEIDNFLPRIANALEFLSKPASTLAMLNTNCSNGIGISVPHEFATMLYVSRREKLIAERAELAKSLRLDGGHIDHCLYAKKHGADARKHCGEWKPVKFVGSAAPAGEVERNDVGQFASAILAAAGVSLEAK